MAHSSGDRNIVSSLSRTISETPAGIVEFFSVLNMFLSTTAFLGNILILIALHRVTSIYPPTKLLFRCLAVTDLLVGLIAQPLFAAYLMFHKGKMNITMNGLYNIFKTAGALMVILCGVSVLTSTAVSVDRLLVLLLGMRYRHLVTLRRVRLVLICFWFICVSFMSLWVWRRDFRQTVSSVIVVPSVITSICSYVKIYWTLRQHQGQIQGHVHRGQPQGGGGIPLNLARYKKTVSSILWMQLALIFCYVPYTVVAGRDISNMVAKFATETLVFLNSSLNPMLYCWKIREVRRKVKETIRQIYCC